MFILQYSSNVNKWLPQESFSLSPKFFYFLLYDMKQRKVG